MQIKTKDRAVSVTKVIGERCRSTVHGLGSIHLNTTGIYYGASGSEITTCPQL